MLQREESPIAPQLLAVLDEALQGASAPVTHFVDNRSDSGLLGVLAGLSAADASRPITGTSIAAHVHHVAFAMEASTDWIAGDRSPRDWTASWRVTKVDDVAWIELVERLRFAHQGLRAAIESPVCASGDALAEAVGAIAHVAYHLGSVGQKLAALGRPRVDPVVLTRYLVRETMGTLMAGVALFWAAGTVAWPMGWVVVGIYAAWVAGMAIVLVTLQPDLIAERLGPRRGGKSWDLAVLGVLGLANLARLIIAGLDRRYGWTGAGTFPLAVMVAAAVFAAVGYGLFVWATASNAFFSQQVRLQEDRGQRVATGGPYGFVRHPGYASALLFEVFAPIALGSWWAVIPSLVGVVALVVRTALEDRALQAELPGYPEYSELTRYRLVPGVW